jgi:hypothetical protein
MEQEHFRQIAQAQLVTQTPEGNECDDIGRIQGAIQSISACGMLSCFWQNAASSSPTRRWCRKFGESFVDRLRRRRPRPGDEWHLDEALIRVQGVQHYLWRAVDQDGVVRDILV